MIDSVKPECVERIKYYPKTKQQEIHEKYPDIVQEIDPKTPKPKEKKLKRLFLYAAIRSKMTKGCRHTAISLFVGGTRLIYI
jgi:hypothetical protein